MLPWLQERARNDRPTVEHILDCDVCRGLKQSHNVRPTTQIVRQSWGCGLEPRNPSVRPSPWMHPGYTDETPTTCPGYTTKLPEVIEISRLRWGKAHERPGLTERAQQGVMILDGAVNEANCWRPTEGK